MSMRKIAKETNISATAIYRHFENKEAILTAIVANDAEHFLEYLSRGLKGKTPAERLQLTGIGYLDFALDHPNYYRLMFMSPLEDFDLEQLQEQSSEDFAATFQFLIDRVRECMDTGVLMCANPRDVATMIWATSHGVVSLQLADHFGGISDSDFRCLYLRTVTALLQGLGK